MHQSTQVLWFYNSGPEKSNNETESWKIFVIVSTWDFEIFNSVIWKVAQPLKNIWSEIFLSEFFNRAGSAARDQKSELIAFCPFWVEVKDGPKSESGRSKRGKAYGHKN